MLGISYSTKSLISKLPRLSLLVLMLVSIAVIGLWIDSYFWHRDVSWGDQFRGNYRFVISDYGGLGFEGRTNCDIDHKWTYYRRKAFGMTPWRPTESHQFLGFGLYSGVVYIWPAHRYGHLHGTTRPAYSDTRWQKEPYRLLRIPYWFLALITSGPCIWLIPRSIRKRRIEKRKQQGLCLHCGYNLTGNVSGICPECGERI